MSIKKIKTIIPATPGWFAEFGPPDLDESFFSPVAVWAVLEEVDGHCTVVGMSGGELLCDDSTANNFVAWQYMPDSAKQGEAVKP